MTSLPPLAGRTIAVTADRRAEEQVSLLKRRGAEVVVAPTIRTLPLVEGERLSVAIEELIAHPPDIVVFMTGIGARGMFATAEGIGRDAELVDALASAHVIVRGPKAAGAATTVGLGVGWQAPSERSTEIVERLRTVMKEGLRIAVQRDGQREPRLAHSLTSLGADVVDIPVYRWELPEDARPAERLVDAIVDAQVDAVTFTSSPALEHLVEIADACDRRDELVAAMSERVVTACVGPVCAETAHRLGIETTVVPNRARLGAMVQALAVHFEGQCKTIATRRGQLAIQGRAVFVDGTVAPIGARERAVLEVLADANGAVVPKLRLLRAVWGPAFEDEHAVEVAVGRLRRGLGPAGDAVKTVPRRGYRLAS